MSIDVEPWGTSAGATVEVYTLTNAQGVAARICTYGGTLVGLHAPDRAGQLADVVLGFDALEPYLGDSEQNPYFGALIGRYANRIARGAFTLDGVPYQLACNNGPNHLHGGPQGFHRAVWRAEPRDGDAPSLVLRHTSADGDEGYPGTLDVRVAYTLTQQNVLQIDYTATTSKATIINLTNHAYFNLAGGGDILGHELYLAASRFLPVDSTLIPTGELRAVAGTPMDFMQPRAIGGRIGASDEQLQRASEGYDHCFVLDAGGGQLALAARAHEPRSGRVLEVHTTQPGLQFYSGNFLDGSIHGKHGARYQKYAAFCLETQHFPDGPNQPHFPSTLLQPGETYRQTTLYQFAIG
jgi:aldose 1-epimerase